MRCWMFLLYVLVGFSAWSQQAELLIFREKIYDFGEIDEKKGPVDHEFIFTNNSARPVKIISVQASCGCTTTGWSKYAIAQGTTGYIRASFDPKGRPGYFNKSLTVVTDVDAAPLILQIKGHVRGATGQIPEDFPVVQGNLQFKNSAFNLGTVYINKSPAVKQFPVKNAGKDTIRFVQALRPNHIGVVMPIALAPGERGVINIKYDARLKNQFGFASDNVQLLTDDPGSELKSISVYATLEEYISVPGPEELSKAPVLFVSEPNIDLGRFRPGAKLEKTITLRNIGKKELVIKALQGNCECITARAEKKQIPAGDSTHLLISFRPQNRGGTQQKAIAIYTNDPRNPIQRISVLGYVED